MSYGSFARDGSAYVIKRFDTPKPWLNLISNETYGLFLSQNGFGFSFYRDWENVKINYINIIGYVPTWPQSGKFIHLRDQETGKCWPNVPMHSARGYSGYRCEHAQGYSRITATRNGIETEFLIYVPTGTEPVEIWQVTLRNRGKRPRRIKAFPWQQWLLTAPTGITDTLTFTRADHRPDLGAIVARMTNSTSPLRYDAFMAADFVPEEWDCSYDRFVGVYGTLDAPQAVVAGAGTKSPASGERMVGALSKTFEIAPGGEVTFRVVTGVACIDADVDQLKRYLLAEPAEREFNAVRQFWTGMRRKITCRTPDRWVDLTANSWVKWQNWNTTRHARGAYRGYRDVLQDIMGLTPLEPAYTRRWLVEVLGRQYSNGLCIRGWNPIRNSLDTRMYRDSPAWIPLTLSAYLRETGDLALLDEQAPYLDTGQAGVFEHAFNGMRRLHEERADNGLCLIGAGDWNDSLDEVAPLGKGQSVWLTIAAVYAMNTLAEVARFAGRTDQADALERWAGELKQAANVAGWDGQWYLYAITDDGRPVGGSGSDEGKIHLNSQVWAIFAGVAEGERLTQLLDVIDNTLETKYGPVLIHPNYTHYTPGIGKVSGKNPGMAENGPIYSHATAFKMLADLSIGRGDKAFESYAKLCPASPANAGEPDRFLAEPYVAVRYLVGPGCPFRFGSAPYSYNSAWPAWTFQLLYERMLGVRPAFDGLLIDPCVPSHWKRFEVTRPFRKATYHVKVANPDGVQQGVRQITVDGRRIEGAKLPIFADGRTHEVKVRMG